MGVLCFLCVDRRRRLVGVLLVGDGGGGLLSKIFLMASRLPLPFRSAIKLVMEALGIFTLHCACHKSTNLEIFKSLFLRFEQFGGPSESQISVRKKYVALNN